MGKSFYSMAVYDIQGGEKMNAKLVVGILLLVSVLLAGTAQAVGLESSMDSISLKTNTQIVVNIPALTAQATTISPALDKMRDVSDED